MRKVGPGFNDANQRIKNAGVLPARRESLATVLRIATHYHSKMLELFKSSIAELEELPESEFSFWRVSKKDSCRGNRRVWGLHRKKLSTKAWLFYQSITPDH